MFELQFLYKCLRLTLYLTLFIGAFLTYYYRSSVALGFMSGSFWNIFNFNILISLIRSIFSSVKPNKTKIVLLFIVKFGLLYVAGFAIIKYSGFSLQGILWGFSLLFVVLFLKALGKVLYERTNDLHRS
jgi:hypothetical protein